MIKKVLILAALIPLRLFLLDFLQFQVLIALGLGVAGFCLKRVEGLGCRSQG